MKKFLLILLLFNIFILNSYALESSSDIINNINDEISSTSIIMYNLNDNKIILEKNKDKEISIASLTKIMTVITALDYIEDYTKPVTITSKDFATLYEEDASLAGFFVGEHLTYNDLLYGIFLPSGAEAAQCLANNIFGSVDDFIDAMNKKAKELNLEHSHFANVTGLDNKNHYSSAQDVATILNYAINNEKFKEIFSSKTYVTSDSYLTLVSTFWYTAYKYNYDMSFVFGAKTGYTDDAGKCLASIAVDNENGINYMLVTCGANTDTSDAFHIKDAYNIYNYFFENYKYQTLISNGDLLVTLDAKYSKEKEISFNATEDITYFLKNDYDKNLIRLEYNGTKVIDNHYKSGDKLGTVSVYYDQELVKNIDIILNDEYHFSIFQFLLQTKLLFVIIGITIITMILIILKKHK